MRNICKDDGNILATQDDIESEFLDFYGKFLGTTELNMEGIDTIVIRNGQQLTINQRYMLISPVSAHEIEKALKSIGDLKSPGVDGFGANFFKSIWSIVKVDVVEAVMESFVRDRMYGAIKTIIP